MKFVLFNLVVGAALAYLILADRWGEPGGPAGGHGQVAAEPDAGETAVAAPSLAQPVSSAEPGPDADLIRASGAGGPVEPVAMPKSVAPPSLTGARPSTETPAYPSAADLPVAFPPDHAPPGQSGQDRAPPDQAPPDLPRRLRELAGKMESRFLAGMK